MTRIDVAPGKCTRVWESHDRMATLPRLSTADGLIHSLGYGPYRPGPLAEVVPGMRLSSATP